MGMTYRLGQVNLFVSYCDLHQNMKQKVVTYCTIISIDNRGEAARYNTNDNYLLCK